MTVLQPIKRPSGLTVISIVMFIAGLYNAYSAFVGTSVDVDAYSYSAYWTGTYQWFKFGVPTELALNVISIILGIMQILVAIGFLLGAKYSYKLGLATPIGFVIFAIAFSMLYATAPVALDFGSYIITSIGVTIWDLIVTGIVWSYLRKPYVKQYLHVIPPLEQPNYVSSTAQPTVQTQQFYCRFCGQPVKADSAYCEACGKKR